MSKTVYYFHSIQNLREFDFEEATKTTREEVRALGKAGWTKYDEMTVTGTMMHFYSKLKRFGVS